MSYHSSARIIEICLDDALRGRADLISDEIRCTELTAQEGEGDAAKENHVRDWWSEEKSFDSSDSVQRPLGIATEEERLPERPAIKEYRSLLTGGIKGDLTSHRSLGCHSQGTGHHGDRASPPRFFVPVTAGRR